MHVKLLWWRPCPTSSSTSPPPSGATSRGGTGTPPARRRRPCASSRARAGRRYVTAQIRARLDNEIRGQRNHWPVSRPNTSGPIPSRGASERALRDGCRGLAPAPPRLHHPVGVLAPAESRGRPDRG